MTIALDSLPPPHVVAVSDGQTVLVSRSTKLPFSHVPDAQLAPRRFSLSWLNVVASVADAIRRHWDEHPHDVWTLTLPRSGELVRVVWAQPPNIQWASAVTASSVSAELDEALAHD